MSPTMRAIEDLAETLRQECPLRELLGSIQQTEEHMAVFYRLCPHDCHTCSDRECLGTEREELACKLSKAAASAPGTQAPSAQQAPPQDEYCSS